MAETSIREQKLAKLLYRAIVELEYVQQSETLAIAQSAEGRRIVREGMVILGVKDLSAGEYPEVRK